MKIFGPVKKITLASGGVAAAVIALIFLVRMGLAFSLASLLVGLSFAIVGQGNRFLWLMVFPVAFAVLIGAPYAILEYLGKSENGGGVLIALLGFALMPVLPGLFLGVAHAIRLRRSSQS